MIKAKVTRADGKTPVGSATVRAHDLDTGRLVSSARSDPSGRCRLSGIPYGYVDLTVETEEGVFAGSEVENVPPSGTLSLTLMLKKLADGAATSPAGQGGSEAATGPEASAIGIAEVRSKLSGQDYWKSPGGIAIVAGIAVVALLAIAVSAGGDDNASTQTVSPTP